MEQPKHTTLGISRNQSEYKVITHSGYFRRSFLTSHRFLLLFLSFFLLLTSHSYATILTVKQDGTGDFTVIQEAYLAASSGDTILVYPGTYYENIDLTDFSKNITIASLYLVTQDKSYIHNTIIDGNHNGSCITIRNTENAEIVICGFTIQNGSGYGSNSKRGGGIYAHHSNPKIYDCIIQNNQTDLGGGVCARFSITFLSGCTIRYNHAFSYAGGVLCDYDASVLFDPLNKSNLYLNYSSYGSDYGKTSYSTAQEIIVDTFTVLNPDQHFVYSNDVYNYPVNDLTLSIEYPKIEPVDHDLYVNPVTGSNENDGLTPQAALKTIAYAYHIIASNSLNPHSIYLSNGVYSPSTNGELFPLNGRSHVSLIGENRDSTIFDADSLYFFFKAYGLMEKFTLKNISLKNGYGLLSSNNFSGLVIDICKNVTIENISFFNCKSSLNPGIYCNDSDSVLFNKLYFKDNIGGRVFAIGNSFEPPKSFKIENCIIIGAGPLPDINDGEGNGLGVSGSLPEPGLIKGKITNLKLTDNLRVPDPWWGPGMAGPLIICWHATVDMSNATIGNNTVRGEQGYAVNVDEGSQLNIYNSIIYGDSLYELSLGSNSGSDFPATANIAYSNIEGGEDEIMNWYNQHTLNWLDGNMDEDPLWAGTGDTAYYLLSGSPCINAGTPMYEEGMYYPYIKMENDKIVLYKYDGDTIHLPPTDLAGKPRISGGRIDMGAYEYQDTTTDIGSPGKISRDDNKVQVYPNPFSAHTFITFRIQNPAQVVVKITAINGRPVKTLMDAKLSKGEYSMTWKGDDDEGDVVKNGTYIVTFYLNGVSVEGVKLVKRNGG